MSMNTIITISRQFGSGGREIGKQLSERYNIPYYDKELIALAAKQSGYSEEVFAKADERATNSLLYSLLMGSYNMGGRIAAYNDMPINDKRFLIQGDIIKEAAQKGPCVIVGRCGDYVLRDFENVFHVFIYADKASRIEHSVKLHGMEPEKAPDILTKKDKQRANYYNFYTNKRWDDPANYHLMINSGIFGIDGSVDLIVNALEHLNAEK